MVAKHRRVSSEFKGKIIVEALKEEKAINVIASEYDLNPNLVRKWKQGLLDHPERVFDENRRKDDEKKKEELLRDERDEMLKTIGALTLDRDWLQQVCFKHGGGEQPPRCRP